MPIESQEPLLQFAWFPLAALDEQQLVPRCLPDVLRSLGAETIFVSTRED